MENYWDRANLEIRSELENHGLGKRVVFYSVGKPLDEVAAKGRVRLVAKVDEFWTADDEARDYRSEILVDPTWMDISLAANEMINSVRDFHHTFLEGIYEEGDDLEDDSTVVYGFVMGS